MVVVLLLVGAGLLIWFLVSRGDDGGSAAGDGSVAEGTIQTDEGQDVLAAAGGGSEALAPLEDRTVRGSGIEVQSVVSDESFWAGSDTARRVFVVVAGGGVVTGCLRRGSGRSGGPTGVGFAGQARVGGEGSFLCPWVQRWA